MNLWLAAVKGFFERGWPWVVVCVLVMMAHTRAVLSSM